MTKTDLVFLGRSLAQREDYIRQAWGEIEKKDISPDTDAVASTMAGFVAGRDTRIRAGLASAAEPRPRQIEMFRGRVAA